MKTLEQIQRECSDKVSIGIAWAWSQGVEITFKGEPEGFALYSKRRSSKYPPSTKVVLVNPYAVCETFGELERLFTWLVDNALHCDDSAPRTDWRSMTPTTKARPPERQ